MGDRLSVGRVLVLGLDGASPAFLRHWASQGVMPFVDELMQEGAHGVLRSTVPPYTPTAWTSMVTGVNPGRHGVFGFTRHTTDGKIVPIDSATCRVKPVWELLAERGRPSVVVNVPMTYPPRAFGGILVSGMGTPSGAVRYTSPSEIQDLLSGEVPGYVTDVAVSSGAAASRRGARAILRDVELATARRLRATELLMRRFPWEFAMVVFEAPDRLQHLFWKTIEPGAPPSSQRDAILAGYRKLDQGLRRLVEVGAREGPLSVLVVSDHGFQSLNRELFLNNYLATCGLLSLAPGPGVVRLARRLPSGIRRLGGGLRRAVLRKEHHPDPLAALDWERTIAFTGQVFEQAVRVQGTGDESLDEQRRVEVEEALTHLRSEDGTGQAFLRILRREDVYRGPFVREAPDLFPLPRMPGTMMTPGLVPDKIWKSRTGTQHGMHHPEGVIVAVGPGVGKGEGISADTEDVTPTVLRLLGEPVSRAFDGAPVDDVGETPVRWTDTPLERTGTRAPALTEPEEQEIAEHLRGLGYLE